LLGHRNNRNNEINNSYIYFCVDPNLQITTLDNKELPDFTTRLFMPQMAKAGETRIYDVNKENQGIIETIDTPNGKYVYGVFFSMLPVNSIPYFIYTIVVLAILNILIILFYCRNMSKNISEVSRAVERVASGHEVNLEKKIAVTSNDEIGDLVIAFNKILGLEKENVETIEKNQAIMVEQERLSSLGQLIGGIAHNLKTPIMSIAGVVEGLTDLIKEYGESIDDPLVNKEDHHEIAKEMQDWVDKVKPYLSYMTEVIDAVKGQAVSMNASTMTSFTIKELITRTQLLMKNELKRRHCNLNLDITANDFTAISGEISALIQVIDNMIINAMDAYGDVPGNVDIKVREDDTKVYIDVTDYAGGIPQKVQDKLFKEMITSKGKNGTGLGLYMSFSTIKGKFKGNIRFETEEGKGTTFFIELPKYIKGNE
jgi:signal transduction histidine kinase